MLLSDISIRNAALYKQLITPFEDKLLSPASYDIRLGPQLIEWPGTKYEKKIDISKETYRMEQGAFVLGTTIETLYIPKNLGGKFEGKSSLGRQGLMTHVTAGFIDPGFRGQITLELHNVNKASLGLYYGMKIGQLAFHVMDQLPAQTYATGHHYQNQLGPQKALANIIIEEEW